MGDAGRLGRAPGEGCRLASRGTRDGGVWGLQWQTRVPRSRPPRLLTCSPASPRNSLLRYIYIYICAQAYHHWHPVLTFLSLISLKKNLGFAWSRGIDKKKMKKVLVALLTPDLLPCTPPRCVLVPAPTARRATTSHTRTYML